MREKLINGRWNIWTTDAIADWDGLSGDPSIPSGWEHERLASMQKNLRYGDTLFDIGTEHGALSVVIGREFVGPESMVLMEPSPEFWPNIHKHWLYNGLADPAGFWPGFLSDASSDGDPVADWWPHNGDGAETPGMAYRSLTDTREIRTITVDDYVERTGIAPRALNVDVEGAELKVLKGAHYTLTIERPLVWVSIHPDLIRRDFGASDVDVIDFMNDFRYDEHHLATDHEEHWLFAPSEMDVIL